MTFRLDAVVFSLSEPFDLPISNGETRTLPAGPYVAFPAKLSDWGEGRREYHLHQLTEAADNLAVKGERIANVALEINDDRTVSIT